MIYCSSINLNSECACSSKNNNNSKVVQGKCHLLKQDNDGEEMGGKV